MNDEKIISRYGIIGYFINSLCGMHYSHVYVRRQDGNVYYLLRQLGQLQHYLFLRRNKMDKTHPEVEEVKQLELTNEELRKALTAMHKGLISMQARLDDHEKVLEKLLLVMQDLTAGQVPNGFRQPKKEH